MRPVIRNPSRTAFAAAFAAFAVAAAATPTDVLTPLDVAALRSVSDAEIAPDGRRIAYVLAVPRRPFAEDSGTAWQELHLVLPDGSTRGYVTGEVRVSEIAWTPDGAGVAFLAKRGGDDHAALHVIPGDGGEARRLVAHETEITAYAFSPDGRRVAFLAQEERPQEKEELEDQGFDAEVYEEDWRPVRVWIADLPEGPLGRAAAGAPRALTLEGSASELRWSPRGDRLALALAPTSLVDDTFMARRVRVVDPASGAVTGRVDNPGKLGQVGWSPDGERLALLSAADFHDGREGRLMVVPAAGGAPRDLLPGFQGHVTDFAWTAPDRLLFLADEGLGTTLHRIGADGSGHERVAAGGGLVWDSISATADGGRLAVVADAPEHPPELFEATFDPQVNGGAAPAVVRRTVANPRLAEVRLARQEGVRHAARDGLELEGVLVYPLDYREGRRYPLILTVHGGPEAHFRNGWVTSYSNPGQVAAARGFAVFYPNYRGSTGRGVEFGRASQGDPAGAEFDDLVDAVDHLVGRGLADPAKVGITGGSYGGYATAWAATRFSERFAAGVMFVGISEMVSKMGTSDIPLELHAVHERAWPWEKWDFFLERSPIYHLDQARTPLLILGGKDDPRVHPSQSLTLYRYLKVRGQAPVRFVRYPGEEHGNRKSAARLDYHLRMLQWFEHYLQGPGGEPPPAEIEYPRPPGDDAGGAGGGR
jgi:dipeptidyl aminopeptidase/acylaminoacyl peptidase